MMNIDEALESIPYYETPNDKFSRLVACSVLVFIYIDTIREQIAEINLLQLIPGIYLILLFTSFIFLFFSSDILVTNTYDIDYIGLGGIKTFDRMEVKIDLQARFVLCQLVTTLALSSVIPLALDSFIAYGENQIENLWSFDEVINLELFLIIFLIALSQIPIFGFLKSNTEKFLLILPKYWKRVSVCIVLIAAVITPTIDGYTQFLFAFSALSLCVYVLTSTQQRAEVQDLGLSGYFS